MTIEFFPNAPNTTKSINLSETEYLREKLLSKPLCSKRQGKEVGTCRKLRNEEVNHFHSSSHSLFLGKSNE